MFLLKDQAQNRTGSNNTLTKQIGWLKRQNVRGDFLCRNCQLISPKIQVNKYSHFY